MINCDILKYLHTENFFLFAGPCVIEDEQMAFDIAGALKELADKFNIPFVFKGSYRKANRSRIDSFQGIGDEKALSILHEVGKHFNIPVVTDIHEKEEAKFASAYVDVLQIPAFLCRQTDLIVSAAETGKLVNIKKGQFLSPQAMKFAVEKVRTVNEKVTVTERGTTFGYQDLIVDFRGIPIMKKECQCPVIMDITHSLQQPNQSGGVTGGLPEMINTIARSSIASGVDGIFLETHPNPAKAKSDGANMIPLNKIEPVLESLVILKEAMNKIKVHS